MGSRGARERSVLCNSRNRTVTISFRDRRNRARQSMFEEAGISAFLRKPFLSTDLDEVVNERLQHHHPIWNYKIFFFSAQGWERKHHG
jgi:hypothetical protein